MEEHSVSVYYTANNVSEFEHYAKCFDAMNKNGKGLCDLNVNRGNSNLDGFVFEYKHASAENIESLFKGEKTVYEVNNNNGIADITKTNFSTGEVTEYQCKAYSKQSWYNSDIDKYNNSGQTMVVSKEDNFGTEYVIKHNGKVEQSAVSKSSSKKYASKMQAEAKLTRRGNAPVLGKINLLKDQVSATAAAGAHAAGNAASFGAGLSIGNNLCAFLEGDQDIQELCVNVVNDTGKAAVGGFVAGAANYLIAGAISQTSLFTVVTSASTFICNIGPLSAVMSLGAGPLFLIGLSVGVGIGICSSIKRNRDKYNGRLDARFDALNEELQYLRDIYNSLDSNLKSYCGMVEDCIGEGIDIMIGAIKNNDFERFSFGLDKTLEVFDRGVLFKNMEDFNQFFYNDDIVLEF